MRSEINMTEQGGSALRRIIAPALIVALGGTAYWTSFDGGFLFDDRLHILGHRRIKELWPLWQALRRNRPAVDYSLAVNYAIGQRDVWGYHLFNLTVHLLAALTLYGVVRRTLLLKRFDGRFHRSAVSLALATSAIWVAHPLLTQGVTYLIQRAESMMGLFYMLTLYGVIRTAGSRRPMVWSIGTVVVCALGMSSKAIMITAPVVVLLYDRMFLSRSFVSLLKRRAVLYAGLASTWAIIWASGLVPGVLSPEARNTNVGFSVKGISALDYLFTEAGVLLHYVRLSIWPRALCLDYDWPIAHTAVDVVLPGLLIVGMLLATAWACARRPALGFIGLWFFLILAPTSSVIPIEDPAFEHRMYLSLAAVAVAGVLAVNYVLHWLRCRLELGETTLRIVSLGVAVLASASLAGATHARNRMYLSESGMWRDVWTKRPKNPRAAENFGTALLAEGKLTEALDALEKAVVITPKSAEVRNGLGFAYVADGRMSDAEFQFREAVRLRSTLDRAHVNLGNVLRDTGRLEEAVLSYRTAKRIQPDNLHARLGLGGVLFSLKRRDEAIREYRDLVALDPEHDSGWSNLGTALLSIGQADEARQAFWRALALNPGSANANNGLAIVFASQDQMKEAVPYFERAIEIKPGFSQAQFNLGGCLLHLGRPSEAIQHYREALQTRPQHIETHYELGLALERLGRTSEAIERFRFVLRARPNHEGARRAFDRVNASTSSEEGGM